MSVPQMFPSYFSPLLYRKHPGTCFMAPVTEQPTDFDPAPHTRLRSCCQPSSAWEQQGGSVLLAWVRICQPLQGSVEQEGHQQPPPAQSHLGTDTMTLLSSQRHSRKVLTARGFQVPVPGREEHAIPLHCPFTSAGDADLGPAR